jgi:hypothetical protein
MLTLGAQVERRYDVELFQKIEALTGRKMEAYPAEQEAVLLLLERVGEAQRIATMQVGYTLRLFIAKCGGQLASSLARLVRCLLTRLLWGGVGALGGAAHRPKTVY